MPENLLSLSGNNIKKSKNEDILERNRNPLYLHWFKSQETMLLSDISASDETYIAPTEGKLSRSTLNDNFYEEFAYPQLFPAGKCGYERTGRQIVFLSNVLTRDFLITPSCLH